MTPKERMRARTQPRQPCRHERLRTPDLLQRGFERREHRRRADEQADDADDRRATMPSVALRAAHRFEQNVCGGFAEQRRELMAQLSVRELGADDPARDA